MGKTAARRIARCRRRKIRPQRRAVSLRRCQKTAADIVNSDAVSERSAKRVPLRAVLCAAKNGQRGSGIAPVASRVRHRIAPRLGAEIFLR